MFCSCYLSTILFISGILIRHLFYAARILTYLCIPFEYFSLNCILHYFFRSFLHFTNSLSNIQNGNSESGAQPSSHIRNIRNIRQPWSETTRCLKSTTEVLTNSRVCDRNQHLGLPRSSVEPQGFVLKGNHLEPYPKRKDEL